MVAQFRKTRVSDLLAEGAASVLMHSSRRGNTQVGIEGMTRNCDGSHMFIIAG